MISWIRNVILLHSFASEKAKLDQFVLLKVRGMTLWDGQRFEKFPCWSKRVNKIKEEDTYKDAARLSVNGILVSLRVC